MEAKDINNQPLHLLDVVILCPTDIEPNLFGLGVISDIGIRNDTIPVIRVQVEDDDYTFFHPSQLQIIDSLDNSNIFDSFGTKVSLPFHQASLVEVRPHRFKWKNLETKKFLEKFKKEHSFIPVPQRFSTINIAWSVRGRGFGEYSFWQDGDKIVCDNECDSKESIKKVLCAMVDQAVLTDPI